MDKKQTNPPNEKDNTRRDFIKKASTISIAGLAAASINTQEKIYSDASKIVSYRPLGNTGLKASDISFGTGGLSNYRVALKAISMGINYFDTAPDYGAGSSEEELGKAIKSTSLSRDKLIITTKSCYEEGYPGHMYNEKKETYIKGVEESLKRLKTDYIDFLLVHALGERNGKKELYRLQDEEFLAAYETLKRDGKVRYLGLSSHNYTAALDGGADYAIDSGQFKLIMLAYNFKDRRGSGKLLEKLISTAKKAQQNGVAFIAMKTLRGAKNLNPELDEDSSNYAKSSFKWILSNRDVSCLVVTMRTVHQINQFIKASGQKVTSSDIKLLKKYAKADTDCELGCSDCESHCPEELKVSSILRYNMYFKNYYYEKYAMQQYNKLDKNASLCYTCKVVSCVGACSFGVDVKTKMIEAHRNLSLA